MPISNGLISSVLVATLGTSCIIETRTDDNNPPPPPTPTPVVNYDRVDLVTDQNDHDLINPWGIVAGVAGFWMADEGTGKVSIYDAQGRRVPGSGSIALGVGITGVTANPTGAFLTATLPAEFVFARLDGALIAWNTRTGTSGLRVVDNRDNSASYTGITYASDRDAGPVLYTANFGQGTIDAFDAKFKAITLPGKFIDSSLPRGYAPFNIQALNGALYVTYALRNSSGDETKGAGLGIVDRFDTAGHLLNRVATGGLLNAPWGLALAPSNFGQFSNALLVGNFGDGRITAYDPAGRLLGQLRFDDGAPVAIDGLWGFTFGNDRGAGRSNVLYFAAGPGDEAHGLYGRLQPTDVTY